MAALGACVRTLQGHSNSVFSVALSPDGALLATASVDSTAKLWSTATGACVRTLQGHSNWVWVGC